MNPSFPEVRAGEPMHCGALTVFPLYPERCLFSLEYLLASEAMAVGTVVVREVSEDGSVCELAVENADDRPVLFLEGEELTGAKQNRAVSSSLVVAAGSQLCIPVCCVQRGRWTYASKQFSAGTCCPPSLRLLFKQQAQGSGGFRRQEAVWREIRRKHAATATRSQKENLCDALVAHRDAVADMRGGLKYPEGAAGVTVALAGKFVCLDLFDKPATLEKLWDRLVQGVAMDALELRDTGRQADERIPVGLYMVREARWERVATVGMGEAYRARGGDGSLATALVVDGVAVHVSVSMPILG